MKGRIADRRGRADLLDALRDLFVLELWIHTMLKNLVDIEAPGPASCE